MNRGLNSWPSQHQYALKLDGLRSRDRVKDSALRKHWLGKGLQRGSNCSFVHFALDQVRPCSFVALVGNVEGCGLLADGQT